MAGALLTPSWRLVTKYAQEIADGDAPVLQVVHTYPLQ